MCEDWQNLFEVNFEDWSALFDWLTCSEWAHWEQIRTGRIVLLNAWWWRVFQKDCRALDKAFDEAFDEAFNEAFDEAFNKAFNKAFDERAFDDEAFEEAFEEVFDDKAYEEAFDKEAFEEAFEEAFDDEAFEKAFEEDFNNVLKNMISRRFNCSFTVSDLNEWIQRHHSIHDVIILIWLLNLLALFLCWLN